MDDVKVLFYGEGEYKVMILNEDKAQRSHELGSECAKTSRARSKTLMKGKLLTFSTHRQGE